ncbi:MAG: TonB-dependent receptor [Burkholderiales bacterium]|nr:TonB-dependent receptor [Burkholderiales bacterium]
MLVACAWPARAAGDLTGLSLEQLLDVRIVGASKYEQTADRVGAAVSVIGREQVRAFGWRTVEEALASLPGIHLSYDRQYAYLGTRGFGLPGDYNTRVLVTVDGNRLNDVAYDGGPLGRQLPIDLDLIERIEFIPGPAGAVYGQNAMFGVVNLVTRRGAEVGGVEIAGGVHHPQRLAEARASWGGTLGGGLDLLVSVTAQDARGQDLALDFGDAGIAGTARGLDGERDLELYARIGRGAWSADLTLGRWRKEDPTGAYFSDPLVPGQYQQDGYALAQWQWRESLQGGAVELHARLFAGEERYRSMLIYEGSGYRFPATSQWRGGELRAVSTAWDGHTLMAGVELQDNARTDQSVLDVAEPANDFTIRSPGWRVGAYLQDEWQLGTDWAATLGLRADRNDRTGTALSPRAALIWRATPASVVKALLGRAHRAPNAYERDYDDGFAQVGNPALGRESIDTAELVLDHRLDAELALRASAYRWRMHDIVTLDIDPVSGLPQYRAGPTVDARGLELSADKTWRGGARLRGSVSLQQVRNADGSALVNSPERMAKLAFSAPLPWAGLRLGWEWQAESGRLALDGSRLGGFALSHLNLAADGWLPGVELSLALRNLLDKRHAHPGADTNWQNAIEQDGRSLRLTARARF